MATYASVADVSARWDGSATEARIQAALDAAHVMLSRRVYAYTGSTLDEWVASESLDAALVRIVMVRAVTRNLDNPKGFLAEHAGEYGYSYGSTKAAQAAARLGFTDEDLADLGIVIAPVGSIRVASALDYCGGVYPSEAEAAAAANGSGWLAGYPGYWP